MAVQREAWPQRYQIRIRGRLGQTMCSAFPALRAQAEGGDTVLTGVLADPAALYGVLAEAQPTRSASACVSGPGIPDAVRQAAG